MTMQFDFEEQGTGPILVFLPGSYSTGAAWRGIWEQLKGSYRLISTSLPGYGGTPEIRPDDATDISRHMAFVAAVAERVGAPFHLVGHSYGGLTALAAALNGAVTPRSLILFEANPMASVIHGKHFAWFDDLLAMVEKFRAAIAAGDPEAAAIIIDFYAQPGAFAAMPPKFQGFCRMGVHANLLDWQSAIGFAPEMADYGNLDMPITLVRGSQTNRQLVDINEALDAAMPNSALHVVPDAGHFLITSHPGQCAAIIDAHMKKHFS